MAVPTPQEDELTRRIKEIAKLQAKVDAETSAAERAAQNEDIKKQIELAEKYQKTHNITDQILLDQLDKLKKQNVQLSAMLLANKSIVNTFKDMVKQTRSFSTSTSEWFKKGEELALQYLSVSKNIGLSSKRTKTLSENFNNTVREAMRLGIELRDVDEIFTSFAEESGRARILGDDEAKNIAKYAAGIGTSTSEASKLAEQFDLMGLSSEKVFGPDGYINEAIGSSRAMGLNSNKVIKTLQSNMKLMQQYSFASGVKGMTNMAKQAVKMRVDVSEILQMADKFYHPEAAIEAAANLQLLGGDIAEAFGDPLAIMYEARNKPEELAKRIGKMTENMVSFNEKTGAFEFPPEARMQLQVVSKELGIGMESLTEMTRQASKIKSIKMNVSGNILDEDMREGIAGMARMKDGKWVVDFEGEDIGIGELSNVMAESIIDQKKEFADKSEKDILHDIAMNTQTFSQMMKNQQDAREYGFAGEIGVYEVTMEGFLRETVKSYDAKVTRMFEALNLSIGEGGGIKQVMEDAFGVNKASGENFITEALRVSMDAITNAIQEGVENKSFTVAKMTSKVTDAEIFVGGIFGGKANDLQIDTGGQTFVSGPAGTFTLDDKDSYYGKDGKFTAGTNLGMDKNISNVTTNNKSVVENKISGNAEVTIRVISDNKNIKIDKDYISGVVGKILNSGLAARDGARLPEPGGANVNQDMLV